MEKLMEVKNLNKVYQNKRGIFDINFDLAEGEIVGLLGPNGSGKTTLMKSITRLLIPQTGDVIINNNNLDTQFEEAIRHVGCLIETPSIISYMTAYNNLKLVSRYYPEIDSKRIDEVLKIVDLEKYKNDKVRSFSLGMKQRLAIAMALYQNPRLIILDEPTNGLDIEGSHKLRSIISSLAREFMITVLISSHLIYEIEMMCDRILIIKDGRIIDNCKINELKGTGIVLEEYFIDKVKLK